MVFGFTSRTGIHVAAMMFVANLSDLPKNSNVLFFAVRAGMQVYVYTCVNL